MENFPIQLFGELIAIRRDDREELSEGGLVIPTGARERPMTGTVVAVGPGILKPDGSYTRMPVEVGDIVVFEQYRQMTGVKVDGEVFHILRANDLLGKSIGGVKIHGRADR